MCWHCIQFHVRHINGMSVASFLHRSFPLSFSNWHITFNHSTAVTFDFVEVDLTGAVELSFIAFIAFIAFTVRACTSLTLSGHMIQ